MLEHFFVRHFFLLASTFVFIAALDNRILILILAPDRYHLRGQYFDAEKVTSLELACFVNTLFYEIRLC